MSAKDQGAQALAFLVVRMSVYGVNGRQIPASYCTVYIWSAVLLLTSMSGTAVTTKRNLISEVVPFVSAVLQADATKPGLTTTEPGEHIFEICRITFENALQWNSHRDHEEGNTLSLCYVFQ